MKNIKSFILILIITLAISVYFINIIMENSKIQSTLAEENKKSDISIIPKPLVYEEGQGNFVLRNDTSIYVNGKDEVETDEIFKIAEFLKEKLEPATGFTFKISKGDNLSKNSIYLTTLDSQDIQGNEEYKLISTNEGVKIIANKTEGISRGIQTLRQLLPSDIEKKSVVSGIQWSIPIITVSDKPEYSYRGLMIDVARHFYTVDEVKRQIDLAAQYKINKVHLHLSDDQGWRLEIKKYPELTKIGGSTEVGGGPGGYYTQDEFKDIVEYAAKRYVEIIPEFDMPGHSNAALASYGFLNPDGKRTALYTGIKVGFSTLMTNSEKTYEFIDDVIKEVSEISPSKYIHIGGDEALSTKKEDYNYFVGRVAKIAEKYEKIPIGWDPIDTSPEIEPPVILQNWQDSNEAAQKKKMKMVISIAKKAYLDMKYDKDTPYGLDWAGYIPIDVAYNWDPTDYAPKDLVLGIEAPLWTETIENTEQMDYMIYPRLLGYAEIGWTPKENRNWNEYKVRLKNQGQRMSNEGINYYKDNSICTNE